MPTSSRSGGHPRLNEEMLIYPVPFNLPVGSVGFGSMEGIDPYIETIGACHSTYSSVSVRFGRLGSRPYGSRYIHSPVEWYAVSTTVGAATSRPQPDGFNAPC